MDKRFRFRVSEKDLEKMRKRAASLGMSTSAFVRESALDSWIARYNIAELNKIVREVNKIGLKINQIVKLCNQKESVSRADLEQIENLLKENLEFLKESSDVKKIIEFKSAPELELELNQKNF